MKKTALTLSVVAMAMGFTACENYELPNPPAQSNPQVAPFDANNINVTAIAAEGETPAVIDLTALNAANEQAPVGNLSITDWPEYYTLQLTMYVSKTEDMAGAQPVAATVKDNVVYVAPDALNNAYKAITADPREATVWVNYGATASLSEEQNGSLYIGGVDYRFGKYQITLKPFDADFVIEDSYYLVVGGEQIELEHSSQSPYDDPVFRKVVELGEAGMTWSVAAKGGQAYGGEGLAGDLVAGQAGTVELTGPVMFEFNMKDMTYNIYQAYTCLYTPGDANGWSQAASSAIYTTDYANYHGWANCQGSFKFCATLDWAVNWGVNDGKLALGGDNITVDNAGCYYLTANLPELTYTVTYMTSCGVIGDATPGAWDAQTNLTQDPANPMIWKGEIAFNESGEWKIRFNDDWAYNIGGEINNPTEGGANFATPGKGTKTVTVNLSTYPYSITVE